ncbi:hypothetical protein MUK42_36688 [Musa troglodytarum]|uniref:Uncharacterized protein n=1 Tax=Musa troglodytarum TaxID=320322 RepID=A0A9E7E9J0_9LILI|nr:hypothetical protein MUK42_36688 [Musa troglodytarum]
MELMFHLHNYRDFNVTFLLKTVSDVVEAAAANCLTANQLVPDDIGRCITRYKDTIVPYRYEFNETFHPCSYSGTFALAYM